MNYPTTAQLVAALATTRIRPSTLRVVRAWKREFRGRRRTPASVAELLERLAVAYGRPVIIRFRRGAADCYQPATHTITLNASHVSIVTALHEFAHHLYGRSELTACRWSVAIFQQTFPRTFARATFDGHMLRVRRNATVALDRLIAD